MGKINWGRVVLCGFLTGVVWGVLSAIALSLVGRDFWAALPGGHDIPATLPGGHHIPGTSASMRGIVMIWPLVLGISTMWLYAAIRPRYGARPETAVVAGFSWWVISSLVDATWRSFGFVAPGAVLAAMAASLPAIIIAAVAGAALHRE